MIAVPEDVLEYVLKTINGYQLSSEQVQMITSGHL